MIKHHQQVSLLDCGLACLKTLLSYYDITANIDSYFDAQDTQGMSLLEIERILKKYQIKSQSYQLDCPEKIRDIKLPCLAVMNRASLAHYIVVISIDDHIIKISDPAQSKVTELTFSSFEKQFSGIVLIPEPRTKHNKERFTSDDEMSESTILYQRFSASLTGFQKLSLFILGMSRALLPIVMTLTLQFVMSNLVGVRVSRQFFIVSGVLFTLISFKIFADLEVEKKTIIENHFLSVTLRDYYHRQLANYSGNVNYDFAVGYFWNLLNSVTGVFQKFYLNIYIAIFCMVFVILVYFNLFFAGVTMVALLLFLLYNRVKVANVEIVQNEMVASSSNFSYLFESSIDGIYDISALDKIKDFEYEFNHRLDDLLNAKFHLAELNNQIVTSIQVFSVMLISTLLLSSHFFYFNSSFVDYSNAVLVILLLASILQPLLTTWITYKRSLYSLKFINRKDRVKEDDTRPLRELSLKGGSIDSVQGIELSKSYNETTVFRHLNFEFNRGHVYVINGDNGSGKTTLLKIIQGFVSPTSGYIQVNGEKLETLVGTDIRKYIGIYSSDFRLFAGSVVNNISFDLFVDSDASLLEVDDFVGLSAAYQVSSNGKNLSQGQKQKILIQRALHNDKSIYIFDEPTSNLDRKAKKQFIAKIEELKNAGKIICIVTHDSDLISISSDAINLNLYSKYNKFKDVS